MKSSPPRFSSVLRRYVLFQIPGISILLLLALFFYHFVGIPGWALWVLVGAWIVKELVTLPFTWRLYARPRPAAYDLMIGTRGVAAEPLNPKGYVRIHGELWDAESSDPGQRIEKGTTIRVLSVNGMRLIVEKL
jgi:membrane protein implicated in regulation of membrane protease activity